MLTDAAPDAPPIDAPPAPDAPQGVGGDVWVNRVACREAFLGAGVMQTHADFCRYVDACMSV